MGIKGLLTFAQHKIAPERVVISSPTRALVNPNAEKPSLVVDAIGFALYSYDQLAPRSFRALTSHVEDFVRNLVECGMRVVFVFDGGVDASKRAGTIQRRREEAERPGRHPFGIEICLRLALDRLSIALPELSYVDAPWEADGVLAALSRNLKCPVLSNDSDFLIYGNTHGLVLFSMINLGPFGPQGELACVMRVLHPVRLSQALHVSPTDLVTVAALVCADVAEEASVPLQQAVNRVCAASKKPPVYTAKEHQRIAAAQARYANQDALAAPLKRPPADFRFSATVADSGEFWWPRGALAGFDHDVLGGNARAVVDPWCAALFSKHTSRPTVKEYCPPLYAARNVAVAVNAHDNFVPAPDATQSAMQRAAAVLKRRLPHVAEWEWAALLLQQPADDDAPSSPLGASRGDARLRAYALLMVLVLAASLDACVFGSNLADLCALDQPACVAEYARQHALRAAAP